MTRIARSLTRTLALLALAAVPLAMPARAGAQLLEVRAQDTLPPRGWFGAGLQIAQPQGEFADYIDGGVGAAGHFLWNLDRRGIIGIRVDAGFVQYGSETIRVCLVTCRVPIDVETTNNIFSGGVGPQLMVPAGPLRPYLTGSVGFAYFSTTSQAEGTNNQDQPFASSTNQDDATLAWTAGGGLVIPVKKKGTPIDIDLGVRYHMNGDVEYVTEDGVDDNPDGSITINAVRSQANFLSYHIGLRIGIRDNERQQQRHRAR